MKVKFNGASDMEPVFGILRGGSLLIWADGGLRSVAANECEIVDDRKSALWMYRDGDSAFAEFFEPYFRENLSNGAPRERFVAESYRELLLREFPRDDAETPKYYGNGLIRCPRCGRIFRPLSLLGMVRCNDRACRLDMNNPFYDPARIRESIEWKRLAHLTEYRARYYCPKTQRYYPAVPSRAELLREVLVEWFREWRKRHHRRRGQEK